MPKKSIRERILARRRHLSAQTCLAESMLVQERFLGLPEYAAASSLALYSPIFNEVFTEEIFRRARAEGKRVAYPRVRGEHLEFIEVAEAGHLVPGAFGVLEPASGAPIPLGELDLVAVPGVAFDQCGYRLGYGKGFYDRAIHLQGRSGSLVGLCFEFQMIESLPVQDHDIAMDLLVSDERLLRLRH